MISQHFIAVSGSDIFQWAWKLMLLVFVIYIIRVLLDLRALKHAGNRKTARRVARGQGLDMAELARRLDIAERDLELFKPVYRSATIPKRRGGTRKLRIPDPPTRAMQRRILHRLLKRLQAHPAACGFEPGKSIVDNALPHVCQRVVIKLDVVDFFTNTTAPRVQRYFQWVGWNRPAAEWLAMATTDEGGLPQGAPTSPRLSNLVNFYMDVQLSKFAARRKGEYTRYADDITFSFPKDYPRRVRGVIQFARRILRSKGYELNGRKLRALRRHQQQRVTGLVVNDTANLPRRTRRWLRAVEHRRRTGGQPTLSDDQLAGWQALRHMINTQRTG
ncbi:RNA-directed DNA polymerase [Planctomycetales bacterium ZRK34]|nr:RNA-directed DNA polymerase [Planctomycetales bacterium ZRK34]